jgi:tRNA G18 (ribose-2'-O)-methylase SpoU
MTMRIDSPSNPRIAAAVKAVETHEKMLLEGARTIEEALDAGVRVEEVFASDIPRMSGVKGTRRAPHSGHGPLTPDIRETEFLLSGLHQQPRISEESLLGAAASVAPARVTYVSARVLRKLSDLPSTRGAVAIAALPHHDLTSLSALLPSKKSSSSSSSFALFLLLDDVQDPANVGAILRSGEAFGTAGAILTPGCAWPFSPRALRASAGSAFRLPVVERVAPGEAVAWARQHGIALAGAAAHGGSAPEALAGLRPLALVIGSEGHGISLEIAASLDHRVTLPLAGRVDSLNAAVAAGILLHILSRPAAPAR